MAGKAHDEASGKAGDHAPGTAPGRGHNGAHDDIEALEVDLLLTAIERRYGYDFRHYSGASLRRRVRRAVEQEELRSISELQGCILHDPDCMQRFVTNLAVCTTSMFRDSAFYLAMRAKVIPLLRTYPFIRIWHAGCATGEEVYSMAILLQEEGIYDRCRLYATDLSDELLDRAQSGIYPLDKIRSYTANYHRAGGTGEFSAYYTADHKHAILNSSLRRNVVFSQHNLASDGSFNEFNVILCRNVMIYFDTLLRDHVHELFYASLGMFGVLGVGMKESLVGTPREDRFEPLDPGARLYRRIR
jgi:chemotaxis protein methyltransferase CheR